MLGEIYDMIQILWPKTWSKNDKSAQSSPPAWLGRCGGVQTLHFGLQNLVVLQQPWSHLLGHCAAEKLQATIWEW
jgi:hypothetical protein